MPREKVILHTITLTRQGEVKHFQVRLPRDAERIIGIETGVRILDPIPPPPGLPALFSSGPVLEFFPARLTGDLRMQSCGTENIFYSTAITEEDANIAYGDFSLTTGFSPKDWTHGYKREEEVIMVEPGTVLLSGVYRDRLGGMLGQDIRYEIKLYVWYVMKEEETNCTNKRNVKATKNSQPL